MSETNLLRFFVLAILYVVSSFQLVAWKYQTKDVYFRFRQRGRKLLTAMHGTISTSNIVLFVAFVVADRHEPAYAFLMPLGLAIMLVGGWLFAWTLQLLGSAVLTPTEETRLVVAGPFRYVRHPMYLGGILAGFGLATAAGSMLGIAYGIVLTLTLADIATAEERDLVDRFGQEYTDYKKRVPRLNPVLLLFRRPSAA